MASAAAGVRTYGLLAWTWTRAALQYPLSLALHTVGTSVLMGLDLAVIAIMFGRVREIGGFSALEVVYLYGTSQLAFTVADCLLGTTDRLGRHIKAGTFDSMLVRPVSPLVQVAAEDFAPRKVARIVPASVALGVAMAGLPLSPGDVLATAWIVACGTVIFSAIWVLAGALQFVMIDGHQAAKGVTYGGGFLTQYPMSIYGRDFVLALTFCVPLAFVNWQPALAVLDHPDPLGLPAPFRYAAPAVAAVLTVLSAYAWRGGLRHYRSTGS